MFKKTKVLNVDTLAYANNTMTHLQGSAILGLKMASLSQSQQFVLVGSSFTFPCDREGHTTLKITANTARASIGLFHTCQLTPQFKR